MEAKERFYLHTLKESFASRQRKNGSYSLRAFAKDLEIDSSNLSAIFQKKRGLPETRAKKIAQKLRLPPKEAALFISSTLRQRTLLESVPIKEEIKKYLLDDKYYKVIAEWEYYAFLQLLSVKNFKHDLNFISERLGITRLRASLVIKNLLALKFIRQNERGEFTRISPSLETSEDIESQALQSAHIENFELAKKKLEDVPVSLRDFSSVTMAVDLSKLPQAKAIIREFQEKLHAVLAGPNSTEVYQFNCQLFPLTQNGDRK